MARVHFRAKEKSRNDKLLDLVKAAMEYSKSSSNPLQRALGLLCNATRVLNIELALAGAAEACSRFFVREAWSPLRVPLFAHRTCGSGFTPRELSRDEPAPTGSMREYAAGSTSTVVCLATGATRATGSHSGCPRGRFEAVAEHAFLGSGGAHRQRGEPLVEGQAFECVQIVQAGKFVLDVRAQGG